MKIKRYLVSNMHEGYERIKEDLGPEAIIISSKKIRAEGIKGLLGAKMIEVTAALENKKQEHPQEVQRVFQGSRGLEQELADVKAMVKKLLVSGSTDFTPDVSRWKAVLEGLEINSVLIDELLFEVTQSMEGQSENDGMVHQIITARLTKIFEGIENQSIQNNIYAFVGPTGVGKTTTLAKLAAQYSFKYRKNVGIVTIDTYRIGAVDQLKTYGSIMGLDVEVVMTPDQLQQAVKKQRGKDVILIDTAGRSPADSMKLFEVKSFLNAVKPLEIMLVLSCATKNADLEHIAAEYSVLDYTRLVFTKVDETKRLGSIVNVAHKMQVPVAYIANGQNVPDDIQVAEPHRLAKLILGEVG